MATKSVFDNPQSVVIDHNAEQGFLVLVRGVLSDLSVCTQDAYTTIGVLRANDIRHFDYSDNVINTTALDSFLEAAEAMEFAV